MIEVTNLSKYFGKFKALDNLNIHVKEGSVYGLLGPNGAGKTTLIKHLTGIYRQDSGTVLVGGEPVYDNPAVKSSIVYIPDDLYFFSQYSIDENLLISFASCNSNEQTSITVDFMAAKSRET